ncbi:phosphatase PAP2 family protein [Vagococcus sp. BWB3-3]|uniref:Phosphatase PAP2 family protein n=1 Tax=Vagococcus allomyrinae TaxID=2794353 RepID=A0A940PCX2_9ENTE|nr:phosphatase PAP2 family protein [Vagococcus allomyrinae]MBP1040448.1 phosphatase PAP2 family protein [Vagococcus allomyrinae]
MNPTKNLYWHFAASCCLVIFVILGYTVKFYEATLTFIDQPISDVIRANMTDGKSTFYIAITQLGSGTVIAGLVLVVSLVCWYRKYLSEALWLIINSALIAGVGNYLIKFAFQRPRPSVPHLVTETHFSFPSGHAMGSMLFYGTLIVILPILISNPRLRLAAQILLGLLILLVGISRIYVGVHYPTDILGGYLLGAAWILGTYPTFQKRRFIWRFQGKQK